MAALTIDDINRPYWQSDKHDTQVQFTACWDEPDHARMVYEKLAHADEPKAHIQVTAPGLPIYTLDLAVGERAWFAADLGLVRWTEVLRRK